MNKQYIFNVLATIAILFAIFSSFILYTYQEKRIEQLETTLLKTNELTDKLTRNSVAQGELINKITEIIKSQDTFNGAVLRVLAE